MIGPGQLMKEEEERMTTRKSPRQVAKVKVDALEQINLNAAGIDIGAEELYVAVPIDRDQESVRVFGTYTDDLYDLASWLKACRIDSVAMESTGIYWVALYDVLEASGLEVYLVNARHLKNVSGRKTDVLDCQWLQQLHTYGLLRASFRPTEEVRAIRSLVRHREMLIQYRSSHIQHMQKALIQMNVRLTSVLSDISGVTGMQIIRAIIAGDRDPKVLAAYRNHHCSRSAQEIEKALRGTYQREHIFTLKQAVELYDFYEQQIRACDQELEVLYNEFDPPQAPHSPAPEKQNKQRRKNEAHFDLTQALFQMAGVDLTQVHGLDALTVQTILSITGTDMDSWPTAKQFASWLHICPNNKITGGKVKGRSTLPTQNRAATALRIAALSLRRSDSALGAFFRRVQRAHGMPVAITATAHKLARIIYAMLKKRLPYHDPGADYFEQRHRERAVNSLKHRAATLGFSVEPLPSF
jgi:transposase